MIKLTAPNGETVEINPAFIVSIYANDGEYEPHAKTILQLVNGVQAVVEDKAAVEAMLAGKV